MCYAYQPEMCCSQGSMILTEICVSVKVGIVPSGEFQNMNLKSVAYLLHENE